MSTDPTSLPGAPSDDESAAEFWDCSRDGEQLTWTTIAEAVADHVDNIVWPDPLPETVTVYGFATMGLPSADRIASSVLDELTGWLDDKYGDQIDGDPTEIPPELRAAALVFAEAVRAHYPVWSCEQVAQREVRVSDYVDVTEYEHDRQERANA